MFTGKGGAVKLNEMLKIQIKVHHQILNEWGAHPILNFKFFLNWLPQPIQGKNLT